MPPEPPGRPQPAQPARDTEPPDRPQDVDTGFWLWLVAVPLVLTGYLADVAQVGRLPSLLFAVSGLIALVTAAIVVTFLLLMRQGYRWARTLLTGGGIASVVYVGTNLFTVDRPTTAAVSYAVTGIIGSVLIAGGVFVLHNKDAHAFFAQSPGR
jgi:hypothetical protein